MPPLPPLPPLLALLELQAMAQSVLRQSLG